MSTQTQIHPEAILSSGVLLVWAAALALPAILGVAAALVGERKHPDQQRLFMAWFNTAGWLMLVTGVLAAGSWTYQAAQVGAFGH